MGPAFAGTTPRIGEDGVSLHRLVGAIDDVLGRLDDRVDEFLQLRAGRWINLGLDPLSLAQEVGSTTSLSKAARSAASGRPECPVA